MSSDIKNVSMDLQQRIRDLAYLMWESAGRQQDMALQYWLNAEREVFSSIQAATEVMMPTRTQPQEAVEPLPGGKPAVIIASPVDQANDPPAPEKEAAAPAPEIQSAPAAVDTSRPAEKEKKAQTRIVSGTSAGKSAPRKAAARKKTTA